MVMLTMKSRARFWAAAREVFAHQTYANRTLLTIDGDGPASFGAKRNIGIAQSLGDIIVHLDDDDWSAPTRVASQVERLLASGKAVTGYRTMPFYDVRNGEAVEYI